MTNAFISVCSGFAAGFAAAWIYFGFNRLLRTREEWYADPVIRERYGDGNQDQDT